jgi:enamine deaminase RidA (YjgF/YER057c/UK114 family)
MARKIVFTTKAAKPPAVYSQAVKAAGLVFVSGTAPIDPATLMPFLPGLKVSIAAIAEA